MSYYIELESDPCPHCGRRGEMPECPDPTYNLTPIFHLALTDEPLPSREISIFEEVVLHKPTEKQRGLRVLDGKKASETLPNLQTGLARLRDPVLELKFRELEPENKWGTLEDAIYVMQRLVTLASEYPDNVWRIC